MAVHSTAGPTGITEPVTINRITVHDVIASIDQGIDDFRQNPSHMIFLTLLFPIIGILLGRLALGHEILPLLFPVTAGFTLVGPLAALGIYEMSRRREQGRKLAWRYAFNILLAPNLWSIVILGFFLMGLFISWLLTANWLFQSLLGQIPVTSLWQLMRLVITTSEGHQLILWGNGIGFLFAITVFLTSAISFPMLLDRNVGLLTAIAASAKSVFLNPIPMAFWGAIIATALFLGCILLFAGLALVLPILGHATWHVYRKLVTH